ncbi:hypothetical protein J6590_035520 [Homalodisca vitripennis]|nr:hypothetical protein J6590_035520 [Homalodisca vitripennis]
MHGYTTLGLVRVNSSKSPSGVPQGSLLVTASKLLFLTEKAAHFRVKQMTSAGLNTAWSPLRRAVGRSTHRTDRNTPSWRDEVCGIGL